MKFIKEFFKKLYGAFIKDDTGEVNLLTVMITALMLMFLYLFIKAEVFNHPISEIMTNSIVQLISIAFGGVGVIGGIRQGVDFVNKKRAEKKDISNNSSDLVEIVKEIEVKPEVEKATTSAFDHAKKYVGLREIEGDQHNPKIVEWLQKLNFVAKYGINSDEVAWCATFVNGVLFEYGLKGTDSPRAKSFLDIGQKWNIGDKLPNTKFALVAISHRGWISPNIKEGTGHVEIVDPNSVTNERYNSIGGNVSDQVKSIVRTYDKYFIEFRLIV